MIKKRILEDIKEAMKARDSLRRNTLRMVHAAIKNAEIDRHGELGEDDLLELLMRESKKREEAAAEFAKANRSELEAKELSESEIIKQYLPEQLNQDELEIIVREAIDQAGATDMSQMGKVMSLMMARVKGRADGKMVSETVRRLLAK